MVQGTGFDPGRLNTKLGTRLPWVWVHPRGNVTGFSWRNFELGEKRLELLSGLVPGMRRVAMLGNVGLTGSYQTEGARGGLPWVCRKHISAVHVLCKNNAAVTLDCAGQQFGVHQLRRLAASLPCPDAPCSSPAAECLALGRDAAAEQARAENGWQRRHLYRALAVRDADDRPPRRGHHRQRRSL